MNKRIGIIGHFAYGFDLCDGQTVKTRNVAMLLEKYGYMPSIKVDTYLFKLKKISKKVKLLLDTLRCMFTCKHIFLLVSVNGMNFYLPFIYYLNKITKRRVYHYVIGSELIGMVDENSMLVKYLNAINVNWFEYDSGTQHLKNKGVKNAVTLPNFKMIDPVAEVVPYKNEKYKFCTFSRVMAEKGITDAIKTVKEINDEADTCIATLDIYGPVDNAYENTFTQLLEENKDCVCYKGVADSNSSVNILKNYYALLFPTYWVGEGVPGTIIDAFAAGIPVIASDWNANSELIKNNCQGYIYPNEKMKNLKDAMLCSIQNPREMAEMRYNSRAEFVKYMPESIMERIIERMQRS